MSALEKALKDLLFLIDSSEKYLEREDLSEKARKFKEREIQILDNLLLQIELDRQARAQQATNNTRAIHQLLDRIQALEAILVIHGIDDANSWLARGTQSLTAEALHFYFNTEKEAIKTPQGAIVFLERPARIIQLPYAIRNRN